METLTIHSHMAHYRLVKWISKVSDNCIRGETDFVRTPLFAGLEAMAQFAALHVRQHLQFDRHAFLLKVHHFRMPAIDHLDGCFRICAQVCNQSSNAFHYKAVADGPHDIDFESELLIGTQDYDDYFPEDVLKSHYKRVWNDLTIGIG
jgi:hypothetical protein